MYAFIWCLIVGLIAGGLARLLIPGKQTMSLPLTMGLGLAGSGLGGVIAMLVFGPDASASGFHMGGLILSTIGAVIILGLFVASSKRTEA